jgi:signal transduction histidine kinase
VTVLAGADQAVPWHSPWQRRAVYAGLMLATLAACAFSLSSISALNNSIHLASAVFGRAVQVKAAGPPWSPHGQAVFGTYRHPRVVFAPSPAPLISTPSGVVVLAVLVALAVVAPLPLVARYPLMGWRIGWLALLLVPKANVTWLGRWPWDPVELAVLAMVLCAAGVRCGRGALWWMWALTLVPWWWQAAGGRLGLVAGFEGTLALSAVVLAAGAYGAWRGARRALAGQAELAELEQARRAVLEERARIARELHDVVAHHMSLIAVRAESAPFRLAGLEEGVAAEFASLSGGARAALADMRRLLGILRQDLGPPGPGLGSPRPGEGVLLAPQPELADVPELIEGARRAGVGVEFVAGDGAGVVPPPVGVCAYRIVQESLSNASRHAPGAPVTVTVSHDDDSVQLCVQNGPPEPPAGRPSANGQAAANRGAGHGLAGMRERVALLGGTLSAGPSPDGGFTVSAILPMAQAA